MENIKQNTVEWVLRYQKEIIFGTIIFITASLSFSFGYLANREFNHVPIVIEKCSEAQ